MATSTATVIGFWDSGMLVADASAGYRFCGILVDKAQVLSVAHGVKDLPKGFKLWARTVSPNDEFSDPVAVESWVEHDRLDVALIRLGSGLEARTVQWDAATLLSHDVSGTLLGLFKGKRHRKPVSFGAVNAALGHIDLIPEQPKGCSGGGVFVGHQLVAVACRRHTGEPVGCAVRISEVDAWLRENLGASGGVAVQPASASNQPLQAWLIGSESATFRKHLATVASESAFAENSQGEGAKHALESLKLLELNERLAKLMRILRATYAELGSEVYRTQLGPWVAPLLNSLAEFEVRRLLSDSEPTHIRKAKPCSLSALALVAGHCFGGRLSYVRDSTETLRPKWVFELKVPPGAGLDSEALHNAFMRELYGKFVSATSTLDLELQLDSAPLDPREKLRLARSVAQVVHTDLEALACVHRLESGLASASTQNFLSRLSSEVKLNFILVDSPELAETEEAKRIELASIELEEWLHDLLAVAHA